MNIIKRNIKTIEQLTGGLMADELKSWFPAMLGWGVWGGLSLAQIQTSLSIILLLITIMYTGFKFVIAIEKYFQNKEKQ